MEVSKVIRLALNRGVGLAQLWRLPNLLIFRPKLVVPAERTGTLFWLENHCHRNVRWQMLSDFQLLRCLNFNDMRVVHDLILWIFYTRVNSFYLKSGKLSTNSWTCSRNAGSSIEWPLSVLNSQSVTFPLSFKNSLKMKVFPLWVIVTECSVMVLTIRFDALILLVFLSI